MLMISYYLRYQRWALGRASSEYDIEILALRCLLMDSAMTHGRGMRNQIFV